MPGMIILVVLVALLISVDSSPPEGVVADAPDSVLTPASPFVTFLNSPISRDYDGVHGFDQWACFSPVGTSFDQQECCSMIVLASSGADHKHPVNKSFCEESLVPMEFQDSTAPLVWHAKASLTVPTPASNGKGLMVWQNGSWLSGVDRKASEWVPTTAVGFCHQSQIDKALVDTIKIHSELSTTGGMHRTMTHNVSIHLPPISHSFEMDLHLKILVFVPSDMFLDMEDPTEGDCSLSSVWSAGKCQVNYHSVRTIDIEQPSFHSPPHVTVVHFHGQGVFPPRATDLDAIFATKIHFRYPMPKPSDQDVYQTIHILPPQLASGWASLDGPKPAQHYDIVFEQKPPFQDPIETNVASTYQYDYFLVGGTTILVGIGGMLHLLRAILRVSKWEQ